MQKIPPQYQAMVFTQMNSEDISQLIQQLPKLDALAAVLSLKEVEASPSQLEQLSEKLKDASAKLPVDFDGMDRIGEISPIRSIPSKSTGSFADASLSFSLSCSN